MHADVGQQSVHVALAKELPMPSAVILVLGCYYMSALDCMT